MEKRMLLGTRHGLVACLRDGDELRPQGRALEGEHVTDLVVAGRVVHAGTTRGIFASRDGGESWERADGNLGTPRVRRLALAPGTPSRVYAGTEPAAIFVSRAESDSWWECPGVADLRDRFGWALPYSPRAGCIRGFAWDEESVYAAAEVGGLLRSGRGEPSWELVPGSSGNPDPEAGGNRLHPDVHDLEVVEETILACTGGGLHHARRGLWEWRIIHTGYCRAAWIDPADPDHLVAGPAGGVGKEGRIEESLDGGMTWRTNPADPPPPWADFMVERFHEREGILHALLTNGTILVRRGPVAAWTPLLTGVEGVTSLDFLSR